MLTCSRAVVSEYSEDILNRISTIVRPDGYLNTSPVTTTLPVVYKGAYIQHVHVVQMFDGGDLLKCRWSTNSSSNVNLYKECGSVCSVYCPGKNITDFVTSSPVGMSKSAITSLTATTRPVNRLTQNYTYVYFNDTSTNASVHTIDCGWDSHILYNGYTRTFYIPSPPWIPGHWYSVKFDSDVASGTEFCALESSPITDPTFRHFDIWNPTSSTTITTTAPPTVGTITTRPLATTTPNTLMTTTGVAIPSTTTFTSTSNTNERIFKN